MPPYLTPPSFHFVGLAHQDVAQMPCKLTHCSGWFASPAKPTHSAPRLASPASQLLLLYYVSGVKRQQEKQQLENCCLYNSVQISPGRGGLTE